MSNGKSESPIVRRSFLRTVGASGVAGSSMLLAGCLGNGSDETSEPEEETSNGTEETTAAPDEIETGGTLTVAIQGDFETLNPHQVSFTSGITVCENLTNSLYRMTPDGEVKPDLAAELPDVSDDGLTITVPINEGVVFHEPYDRELTAEDVVANFHQILDEDYGAPGRGAYVGTLVGEDIDPEETVEQTGEYEVTFNLEEPYGPFVEKQASMSAFAWFAIIPMEALDEHGEDFGTFDTGVWATGPFKYNADESQSGSEYILDRNPNYFREGEGGQLPYLDQVRVKIVPEASVRTTQLKAGEVDVDESVAATDVDSYEDNDDVNIIEKPSTAKTSQWINIKSFEPLMDNQVRKALMHAMNKDTIVETKFQGHAEPAIGPFPTWHRAYDPDAAVQYEPDMQKAQQLLGEAGYEGGFEMKCEPTNQPKFVDVATLLQQQYSQIDVDMEVEPASQTSAWDAIATEAPPSDWNSLVENFTWGFAADDYAYATFHSDAVYNYSHWSNEEADELMEEARTEPNQNARKDIYDDFVEILTDELPQLFIVWNNAIHGYRSNVHNLRVWPTFYMWWEDVWKES